jgi:lipopolysaccharide/colanic/teichoic acid biosynthesis glycosyltransferase
MPRDIAFLGNTDLFGQIVAAKRPSRIVVSDRNWASAVSPATLLNCRLTGIAVDDVCTLYEKVFDRICCARISPAELVLAPELVASPRTMAIQSVYTDLAGLFFLMLLSPLLILVSVGILLLGGPGPILERVECLGFQRIPFYLLRFRIRRHDASRQLTRLGRLIMRLGLMNLPHLINVIRGEMSLFGPNPVRREFAARLIEVMPFYSHRFSVKPGVLSWAEVHLETDVISNEALRIEYDLFYIKENSPTLDLEILIRFILGRWKHPVIHRTATAE